jgi:hypothetical protein
VAIIVAVVLGLSGNKKASAGEIFLSPASDPGKNTFTPNVGDPPPVTPTSAPSSSAVAATVPSSGGSGKVASLSGGEPGLYGGTRDNSSCDAKKMLDYLNANPDKARAWASVEGISVARLSDYVSQLTPIILRVDTRVTNHGFLNGRATSIQAVLQAGTAVLVDSYGVPRVKCNCGNPLSEPVAVTSSPSYTGDRWPTFSPTTIVVVNVSTTIINNFTLIDINTGGNIVRQAGGAVTGVVDTNAPATTPTPTPTQRTTTSRPPPAAAAAPSSLQDVVGTYGNLQVSTSGECGGFTPNNSGQTFQVTLADPSKGVVTIQSTGTFTGTLTPDYSFRFTDPSSSAALEGRFQRKGGTVVMSGSESVGGCSISFTAQRIGG